MKHIVLLLIFVLLLFACSGNLESYNQKLKPWIGKSVSDLEKSWGKPSAQKMISENTKVLTYIKQTDWYVPIEYYYDQVGWGADEIVYDPFFTDYGMSPYAQIVDTEMEGICQTSFFVINGVVQSYKWRGNGCF